MRLQYRHPRGHLTAAAAPRSPRINQAGPVRSISTAPLLFDPFAIRGAMTGHVSSRANRRKPKPVFDPL